MTAVPEPLELIRSHEVHQRVYADPDIFQLEMQRVFGHSWILLGHECQAANPGDFFLGRVGLKPVIVTRDRQHQIRVFLNSCPHRGAAICAERSGHVTRFICPYHAWTFALNGKLLAMPLKEEYGDSFDWQTHSLSVAGEVALYRGFIFLRQRPGGADLETFLGDTKAAFDNLIDRSPSQELEVLPMVQRYRVRANLKLIM
jgi:phenylpropionate dioxygenase-like ring-hydroxylating dioxygenase large terminal subunit